jgi:RNA polymerase sigma-70 factor (ECF subfamily)
MKGETTWWTMIDEAARGGEAARAAFAERYLSAVRAYLGVRWRAPSLRDRLDDAVQEVFLECFREGGGLGRADPDRPGGFRAYLVGLSRNVARRFEERWAKERARAGDDPADPASVVSDETTQSAAFDREWGRALLREAASRHARRAASLGEAAVRRVDLLRLRFQDGLPIRDIAERWSVDAADLHVEYARARREFRAALREVVAERHPGSRADVDAECRRLADLFR